MPAHTLAGPRPVIVAISAIGITFCATASILVTLTNDDFAGYVAGSIAIGLGLAIFGSLATARILVDHSSVLLLRN